MSTLLGSIPVCPRWDVLFLSETSCHSLWLIFLLSPSFNMLWIAVNTQDVSILLSLGHLFSTGMLKLRMQQSATKCVIKYN